LHADRRPRPAAAAPATATQITGSHHGRPSGPTSVNDASAASTASMLRIGTSAAIRAGTRGASSGAVRRSTAIRAAVESCVLMTLARLPTPAA
jgi:hypothetical protein